VPQDLTKKPQALWTHVK